MKPQFCKIFLLNFFFALSTILQAQQIEIKAAGKTLPGASSMEDYILLLKNKRVGVVGNQSSLVGSTHLVDSLLNLDIKIVKVFTPEHGFRGDADAGTHIASGKDGITGLELISLYGNHKKPAKADLFNVDIILFDLQDVGVRFYTYISTLTYVMEACAENEIPLIVLDRPNPNGFYIDGPVLRKQHSSFVGLHPVPIVYGMTIGEYAMMVNGEKWTFTFKKIRAMEFADMLVKNEQLKEIMNKLDFVPSEELMSFYDNKNVKELYEKANTMNASKESIIILSALRYGILKNINPSSKTSSDYNKEIESLLATHSKQIGYKTTFEKHPELLSYVKS